MRISTLNTALSLSLKNDPSKGKGEDDSNPQDGSEDTDNQGQGEDSDSDQDGSDKGSDGQDSDDQKPSDKGSDSEPQDGSDKGSDSDSDGDNEGDTDEGYGDQSGAKDKHQGGGAGDTDVMTDVAQQLADAIEQGLFGTTDRDDALQDTVRDEQNQADPLQQGEHRYNAHMSNVPATLRHNERDTASVNRVLKNISREVGQVKVGLQRLVRAMEQTNVSHGTRDGRLSSRMYARTWSELKGGKRPTRPNYQRSEQMDISIACSVVVDQSSSMSGLKQDTIKGMLALADALNGIKASTQVIGYRHGGYNPDGWHGEITRREPALGGNVAIDIFQQFGETFTAVKGRFAHLRATGGTPTADGMQYALESLSERNEAFRIMFVLTDGYPDGGHQPVINRQIRLAKEAGIHVIGVGLGYGSSGVVSSYPDHIVAENMTQLPDQLLAKLRTILKPSANKRGKRVAK